MRTIGLMLLGVGIVMGTAMSVAADTVRVGDDRVAVYNVLGEPKGYIAYGDKESLFYERGRLELTEGLVTMVDLMSAEELAVLRAEREAALRRAQQAEEERQARMFVEGSAILERKLVDEDFMSAPAEEQVSYWHAFQSRYPNVPIGTPYEEALAELEDDLAARTQNAYEEERLATLEQRVRDAEDRALLAEVEAREARIRSSGYYLPPSYGVPYSQYVTYVPSRTRTYRRSTPSCDTIPSSSFVRNAREAGRPNVRAYRYSGSPHLTGTARYRASPSSLRARYCGSTTSGRIRISF